jgi:cellulose synthase/poly-beta-1,6-N-acetylglucosamine synthase-like glycosyltransferase
MLVISGVLAVFAGVLAALVAVLLLEIVAAALLVKRETPSLTGVRDTCQRVAVLVPAHNESRGIRATIHDVKSQLGAEDRIVVVADNCTDDTAVIAAAAGAEVVERHDLSRIGKGYALDFGLRHLHAEPPPTVILIDADCRLSPGAIDHLARTCVASGRPVQGLYLMTAPDRATINYRVAEFAWRVKNLVRPLGLGARGLPCHLLGTGMAFPWEVICSAELASEEIVEDLKLGLDLAAAGHAPLFCPSAVVTSQFPTSAEGAKTQRQRWEHGHLGLILTLVPRLIGQAIVSGNVGLLALALDLAVPPLALLGLLLTGAVIITGVGALVGLSPLALTISAASFAAFVFAVLLSWLTHGRDLLPPAALLSLVPYVLGKFGLYGRFLSQKRASRWIRTDRD